MANVPSRGSVKVVLIETRYVKADPTSFKSVVQSLTGKDSCVAWVESSFFDGSSKSSCSSSTTTSSSVSIRENNKKEIPDHRHNTTGTTNDNVSVNIDGNVFSRGMSFKDMDRMLPEMPPLEDLQYWLSDEYQ